MKIKKNTNNFWSRKNKKIAIFSLSAAAVIVPVVLFVSYSIVNDKNSSKKEKTIKIDFLKNGRVENIKNSNEMLSKIEKNVFENKEVFFFEQKNIYTFYDDFFNNAKLLKDSGQPFDFSEIKKVLKNIKMETLSFNDLYFYWELTKLFDVKIDNQKLENIVQKYWSSKDNLFFVVTNDDVEGFKMLITLRWLNYLQQTNDKKYIPLINEKITALINSKTSLAKGEELLLGILLKLNIKIDKEKIFQLYSDWKNEIIQDLNKDILNARFGKIIWFLTSTDGHFAQENADVKKMLLDKINNLTEKDLENMKLKNIDLSSTVDYLGKNNINQKVLKSAVEVSENFFKDKGTFSISPNLKKTFYTLLSYKTSNKNIDINKIQNMLQKNSIFLDYQVSKKDMASWVEKLLYSEKIEKIIDYKKTDSEEAKLKNKVYQTMLKASILDFKTIFNLLEVMKIRNINLIPNFFKQQMINRITSFERQKNDNQNQDFLYVYFIDKTLNLNLVSEDNLVQSLEPILKNPNDLTTQQLWTIYEFFQKYDNFSTEKIRPQIIKILLDNKQKILDSASADEESLFLNGLLTYEYENL